MNIKLLAAGLTATAALAQFSAAPLARAETCYEPNCFAAIAVAQGNTYQGYAFNYTTQAGADARALSECHGACTVVIRHAGPGCIAVASNGNTGEGPTADAALQAAIAGAPGVMPWQSTCNAPA